MGITFIVVLVIALALFFDFTNGFHDTANAMATPIATGAIKPKTAVALAAILNLVGAFLSTEVAKTISGGLINEGSGGVQITPLMIFAGLLGAIVWNILTWLFGLPSSSSHALFGGLIGAAIVGAGFAAVNYGVLLTNVLIPAVLAPVIAGGVAFLCTKLAYRVTRRQESGVSQKRGGFRHGQVFSSSLVALAHGTNDAQKTMGVITLVLIAANLQDPNSGVHIWVIAACACAIALGTYIGGWRIIETLGSGLTEVKPAQGFAAETSTAAAILASSHLGYALSTTQVASGSVVGSGLGRKGATVKWGMAGRIATGWLFTLPSAALMGAVAAFVTLLGTMGVVIDVVVGLGAVLGMFLWSKRSTVDHETVVSGVDAIGGTVHIPTKKERKKARKQAKKLARKQEQKQEQKQARMAAERVAAGADPAGADGDSTGSENTSPAGARPAAAKADRSDAKPAGTEATNADLAGEKPANHRKVQ